MEASRFPSVPYRDGSPPGASAESSLGRIASIVGSIWKLAVPYFRSEDRRVGRLLLIAVVAMELAAVGLTVLINQWNARFYNALQDRSWDNFLHEVFVFACLAGLFIGLRVYQTYLTQWLQIRWRRWLTKRYLRRWLYSNTHYLTQIMRGSADNPDQRIAEDTRMFVDLTLTLGVGLLSAAVTLLSFIAILWGLSAQSPIRLFGSDWSIPGYLVWFALIYAVGGTAITHLIGRHLVGLNFNQQRYEADFRFGLVRVRENGEQIALLKGGPNEHARLMDLFASVAANWFALMSRQKKLAFFTTGFQQVAIIFPYLVASPAYFAGLFQLGGLMQTASAFNSVQSALSFFASSNTYRELAEWRAVIARLEGFDEAIKAGRATSGTAPSVVLDESAKTQDIRINELELWLPTGDPVFIAENVSFAPGDRALITGISGSGKSTLFRAIAGIWPFGTGSLVLPSGARMLLLPQQPYLPVGSLEAAITYPVAPTRFKRPQLIAGLCDVGLTKFSDRLDEVAHWDQQLSLGEQQRLGVLRAIMLAPDYLFLDEATASLDEASEAALYRLIQAKLPRTVIVSIGHRSTLKLFHNRFLALLPEGDYHRLYECQSRSQEVVFSSSTATGAAVHVGNSRKGSVTLPVVPG